MKKIRLRLIHMSRCRGITRKTIQRILSLDPTLTEIYQLSSLDISKKYSLSPKNASFFYSELHNLSVRQKLKQDLANYQTVTIVDENYPRVLNTIKDPPLVLYAVGDLSLLLYSKMISVIGTRQPSKEAMEKMKYIVKPLVMDSWLIVSGMARGIDSFAHTIALQNNGKTIAVLGSGFEYIYPKKNIDLFHQIANNGLLLSEYPPSVPPVKFHFPERNRIISGLSFGTLVIEATERSGTLITVDQALDQGREVYAVPGSPIYPQTKGCHRMIQDGAKLVCSPYDINEDWENIGQKYLNI